MTATRSIVLIMILLVSSFVPVAPILALDAGEDMATFDNGPMEVGGKDPMLLRFRIGHFDPLDGDPLPDLLKVKERTDLMVVQFDGHVQEDWTQNIQSLGCRMIWYIPDNAFLYHCVDVTKDELGSLPHVRYVGQYQPGYKLSPDLYDGEAPRSIYIEALFSPGHIKEAVASLGGRVTSDGLRIIRAQLPRSKFVALAHVPEVGWIEPGGYGSFLNDNSARILKARQDVDGNYTNNGTSLWSYNGTGFQGTTGKGINVMVTDTGVDGTHPAFEGRKISFNHFNAPYSNWTDYMGHGTHVSGTILGNGSWRPPPANQGVNGTYAGLAPEANLMAQMIGWDGNDDFWYGLSVEEVLNATDRSGADISSNSWGCCAPPQSYSATSELYDDAVRDSNLTAQGNQSMVYVFAAGNSGPDQIVTPGVAKNVITVGATGDRRGNYDEDYLTGFSSKGPTADGRRKPDVVAPGLFVMSARANVVTTSYIAYSGTSMATPAVAGASAVVMQYYNDTYGTDPSPAMVKAILVNGADQLNNTNIVYADSNAGWGRVNLSRSLQESGGRHVWGEDQRHHLSTGDFVDYEFSVLESKELRVHLAWTDPGASPAVDPALVNDLDLEVYSPNGTLYMASNFQNNQSIPSNISDTINNVEGFRLFKPEVGNWRVRVNATNVPMGPQDYAIRFNGWTGMDLIAVNATGPMKDPVEGDLVQFSANVSAITLAQAQDVPFRFLVDGNETSNGTVDIPTTGVVQVHGLWSSIRGSHTIGFELDPLDVVPEAFNDNNDLEFNVQVENFGLEFHIETINDSALPGNDTTWQLVVNNTGTLNDTYRMLWGPIPPGWGLDALDPIIVEAGGSSPSFINVTTPPDALSGDQLTLNFSIASVGNDTYNGTFNITSTVLQTYDIWINISEDVPRILPGTFVNRTLTIQNLGNGPDTFSIEMDINSTNTTNWTVDPASRIVDLDPFETGHVLLDVGVDKGALAKDRMTIDVTIKSLGREDLQGTLSWSLEVANNDSVEVTLAPLNVSVYPGGTTPHEITFVNAGNSPEEVSISESVLPLGWVLSGEVPDKVLVDPFSSMVVPFNLTVPRDALATDYYFNVSTVWTWDHPFLELLEQRFDNFTILIGVQPVYNVSLTVEPTLLNGTAGDNLTLGLGFQNLGNAQDIGTIYITGLHPNWTHGNISIDFDLSPNGTGYLLTWINTTNDTAGNYTLKVHQTYGMFQTNDAQVQVVLEAPPPPPPPPPPTPSPSEPEPETGFQEIMSTWGLPIAIIILAAVAILVLVALRTKRKGKEGAASHEHHDRSEYPDNAKSDAEDTAADQPPKGPAEKDDGALDKDEDADASIEPDKDEGLEGTGLEKGKENGIGIEGQARGDTGPNPDDLDHLLDELDDVKD